MAGGEMTPVTIRKAKNGNLAQLIESEEKSFSADRISRRSWQALLRGQSPIIVVARHQEMLAGTAVVQVATEAT